MTRTSTGMLLAVFVSACAQNRQPVLNDLQEAIERETTAALSTQCMAERAAADSIFPIEAFFKAVACSKNIMTGQFQKTLDTLGSPTYTPAFLQPDTPSDTRQNIAQGLSTEQLMKQTYTNYRNRAHDNKCVQAEFVFRQAQQVSENLQRIYTYLLGNIDNRPVLAAVYLLCPNCGNLFIGTTSHVCDVCQTPSTHFISYSATHTDATTGATRIE